MRRSPLRRAKKDKSKKEARRPEPEAGIKCEIPVRINIPASIIYGYAQLWRISCEITVCFHSF
jgi:hypothetical protein